MEENLVRCVSLRLNTPYWLGIRDIKEAVINYDFSWDLENPSPNLSPTRREALTFPPSLVGKGVRGLGFTLAFPHNVKSQE
jgi:hypothetical protein